MPLLQKRHYKLIKLKIMTEEVKIVLDNEYYITRDNLSWQLHRDYEEYGYNMQTKKHGILKKHNKTYYPTIAKLLKKYLDNSLKASEDVKELFTNLECITSSIEDVFSWATEKQLRKHIENKMNNES